MNAGDNVVSEAIILAGGLGTRLRSAVPDLPKCLAPVAGKPFLSYVIDQLRMQGISRIIFSLGHLSEKVTDYISREYPTLEHDVAIEEEPLGTGGAIRLSLQKTNTSHVAIVNGDTLFRVSLQEMARHASIDAECIVALKPMKFFDRYGSVKAEENGKIIAFREKTFMEEGLINGGVYILDKEAFLKRNLPGKFSFEKDYLEKFASEERFYGSVQDGYFIDIGIPEDFEKAGTDLSRHIPALTEIDKNWSVFLDRDGVINRETVGRYVLNPGEFHFLEGVPQAVADLRRFFGKIFIVSNQRGVGKGLMSEKDLADIHNEMQKTFLEKGGRIDKIYYCTEVDNSCFDRKPNPGMALRATKEFPAVDLQRSVMVGNKPSDMKFGRAAGMVTVFITSTNPDQPYPHPDIDYLFSSLPAFVNALKH